MYRNGGKHLRWKSHNREQARLNRFDDVNPSRGRHRRTLGRTLVASLHLAQHLHAVGARLIVDELVVTRAQQQQVVGIVTSFFAQRLAPTRTLPTRRDDVSGIREQRRLIIVCARLDQRRATTHQGRRTHY